MLVRNIHVLTQQLLHSFRRVQILSKTREETLLKMVREGLGELELDGHGYVINDSLGGIELEPVASGGLDFHYLADNLEVCLHICHDH